MGAVSESANKGEEPVSKHQVQLGCGEGAA